MHSPKPNIVTGVTDSSIHSPITVACVWDFDKTLIRNYMQAPLFEAYGIDGKQFWKEVNGLPDIYEKRGIKVSKDTIYLNHLITYIRNGPLRGLNNQRLRELGAELNFYPGLPGFFSELNDMIRSKRAFRKFDIMLEHYVISTGLAEMIRGSAIAEHVEGIYGCELIENPCPPGYIAQKELIDDGDREISQIGVMVDNTIKTRFIFEINKGTNKNPDIDVNSKIDHRDRRVPIQNMIYIADGPSDVPAFAVVRKGGGKCYAVYDPSNPAEFAQNDHLLQAGRIHAYGPADYTSASSTHMWLKMHLEHMCDRIVREQEYALANRIARPPQHIHKDEPPAQPQMPSHEQGALF